MHARHTGKSVEKRPFGGVFCLRADDGRSLRWAARVATNRYGLREVIPLQCRESLAGRAGALSRDRLCTPDPMAFTA